MTKQYSEDPHISLTLQFMQDRYTSIHAGPVSPLFSQTPHGRDLQLQEGESKTLQRWVWRDLKTFESFFPDPTPWWAECPSFPMKSSRKFLIIRGIWTTDPIVPKHKCFTRNVEFMRLPPTRLMRTERMYSDRFLKIYKNHMTAEDKMREQSTVGQLEEKNETFVNSERFRLHHSSPCYLTHQLSGLKNSMQTSNRARPLRKIMWIEWWTIDVPRIPFEKNHLRINPLCHPLPYNGK